MDCAAVNIHHVKLDEAGRFKEYANSGLEECLNVEANIDQTGRAFRQDAVLSLLDEGVIGIVPVETDVSPFYTGGYDIQQLRVGRVVQWYPKHVRLEVYNENTGRKQEITLPKNMVALPENPFHAVMNEPNSTLQRLQRKLALLDLVDERTKSGRMDLVIQVPYNSRSEMQRAHAESRRKDLEDQLENSKYGVAWMDGTEKIVQLNRPLENNLLDQIEALRTELYSQLGLTKEVFEGNADEPTMLNYNNRTLEPIMSAIVDEMKRKFLTKTARTQRQSIMFFREPFKLVPVSELSKIADVFTRNAILSSNELRAIIGFAPSDSQRANELMNKNMPIQDIAGEIPVTPGTDQQNAAAPPTDEGPGVMDTPVSELMGDGGTAYE